MSIDTMPLTMFYTEGMCLDLSYKGLRELIEPADLERALAKAGLDIKPGDYENLVNLHQLIGRGRFRFIGLPLKIRGGTGLPVRAVAVFEG